MPPSLTLPLGLLAVALAGPDSGPVEERGIVIERQMILRVPVRPRAAPWVEWREQDGPRCIHIGALAGASLSGPNSIDFIYRNRERYRARLDSSCAALDFYSGFYLQPDGGRICAGLDVIRSRMGSTCRIEQFLRLRPRIHRRPPDAVP